MPAKLTKYTFDYCCYRNCQSHFLVMLEKTFHTFLNAIELIFQCKINIDTTFL